MPPMAYTFPPGTDAMAWFPRAMSSGAIGRHVGSRLLRRGLPPPPKLGWPPSQRRGRRLRRLLLLGAVAMAVPPPVRARRRTMSGWGSFMGLQKWR